MVDFTDIYTRDEFSHIGIPDFLQEVVEQCTIYYYLNWSWDKIAAREVTDGSGWDNYHIHHPESLYGPLVIDVSAKQQKEELVIVIRIRVVSHLWTVKKRNVFFTLLNAQKLGVFAYPPEKVH